MEDKTRKVLVKNRSTAVIVIKIPNRNIRVVLQPGQTVSNLTFADLEEYSYQPGGDKMLREYLQLAEAEVEDLHLGEPPLEYNFSEQDVKNLLTTGSLDAFLDCLDFAPVGVIDLVKKYAVDLPLTDTTKLEALKEKTGFNAAAALQHVREEKEDGGEEEAPKPTRRVVAKTPGRRVVTPSK